MTEIDGVTFEELSSKWNLFKINRYENMKFDDPLFITVRERESIIDKLIEHYKFLEEEYYEILGD